MFKAAVVERNIRNTSNRSANKSFFVHNCRFFSLSLQWLSWDLLRTKNISSTHSQIFCKVNELWLQKRCGRNHIVYILSKIIQTSSLGRLQKKLLQTQWMLLCSICTATEIQKTTNRECQNTLKQIVKVLFQCF